MLEVTGKLFPKTVEHLKETLWVGNQCEYFLIMGELNNVARTLEDIAKLQQRIFQKAERPNSTEQTKGGSEASTKICPQCRGRLGTYCPDCNKFFPCVLCNGTGKLHHISDVQFNLAYKKGVRL